MSSFNLTHIINKHKIDIDKLSKELFSENKFPKLALQRVLDGKSFLDTNQLDILSRVFDVPVHELFTDNNWSQKMNNEKIIFYKNDYRVEFSFDNFISSIYYKDSLIASEVLISDKTIKLSEYLKEVNNIIINLI